jgi:hypothetical protein
LDDDCKLMRVLKAVHQNVVFVGIYHLKCAIPSMSTRYLALHLSVSLYFWLCPHICICSVPVQLFHSLRDVRSSEGWQIYVHIHSDVIVITHCRREQALGTVSLLYRK